MAIYESPEREKMSRNQKILIALGIVAVTGIGGYAFYKDQQQIRAEKRFINSESIDHVTQDGDTLSHFAKEENIPTDQMRAFIRAVRYLNSEGIALHDGGPRKPKVGLNGLVYANVKYKLPDINGDGKVGGRGHYSNRQPKNLGHTNKGIQGQRR